MISGWILRWFQECLTPRNFLPFKIIFIFEKLFPLSEKLPFKRGFCSSFSNNFLPFKQIFHFSPVVLNPFFLPRSSGGPTTSPAWPVASSTKSTSSASAWFVPLAKTATTTWPSARSANSSPRLTTTGTALSRRSSTAASTISTGPWTTSPPSARSLSSSTRPTASTTPCACAASPPWASPRASSRKATTFPPWNSEKS